MCCPIQCLSKVRSFYNQCSHCIISSCFFFMFVCFVDYMPISNKVLSYTLCTLSLNGISIGTTKSVCLSVHLLHNFLPGWILIKLCTNVYQHQTICYISHFCVGQKVKVTGLQGQFFWAEAFGSYMHCMIEMAFYYISYWSLLGWQKQQPLSSKLTNYLAL